MPRTKRSYVPKTRGCYECSQRRIHCDRTKPCCRKCLGRGLQCSGLGVRYRFIDEPPLKKRLTGHLQGATFTTSTWSIRYDNEHEEDSSWYMTNSQESENDVGSLHSVDKSQEWSEEVTTTASSPCDSQDYNFVELLIGDQASEDAVEGSVELSIKQLNILDSFKESGLHHFSNWIAEELVAIDDDCNGWRHFVISVAYLDELVMDAVLAVSAFHYHTNFGECLYEPSSHYIRAIQRLRQRQNLMAYDVGETQKIILAILVLLVTVMVNGSSDFPILFRLLNTAMRVVNEDEMLFQGDLGKFLQRQIQKLHIYAAPVLSQREGIEALSSRVVQGVESLVTYYHLYPQGESNLSILADLGRQAQSIYLKRATANLTSEDSLAHVERFKNTLLKFPPGSPGEQCLVWATFIAASESSIPDHQQFFREMLWSHYRRSGFVNVLKALEHLEWVWLWHKDKDWTALLPELRVLIV